MGRKPNRSAPSEPQQQLEAKALSLGRKAQETLTTSTPSAIKLPRLHTALSRSDNADITKRNASRKKKYLFLFPGALQLPPGAQVGQLDALDTATPTLCINVRGGCVVMCGTLVLPKNAFFTLKAGARRREVRVVDNLDTIVVFSEWRFEKAGNTCDVPHKLLGGEGTLWKCRADVVAKGKGNRAGDVLAGAKSSPARKSHATGYVEARLDNGAFRISDDGEEAAKDAGKDIEQINLIDNEDDDDPSDGAVNSVAVSGRGKDAPSSQKLWTQTRLKEGCAMEKKEKGRGSGKGRGGGRAGRRRLKRTVEESDEDNFGAVLEEGANAGDGVRGRSSGRKRKKVNYTQSEDEAVGNENDDEDDGDDDAFKLMDSYSSDGDW